MEISTVAWVNYFLLYYFFAYLPVTLVYVVKLYRQFKPPESFYMFWLHLQNDALTTDATRQSEAMRSSRLYRNYIWITRITAFSFIFMVIFSMVRHM